MKKFLVMAVMAVMALGVSAQVYVGGSLGAWRDGSAKMTHINILPEVGYNLSDTWAIGTVIGWDYYHQHDASLNLVKFDPYARYSFVKAGNLSLFVDGGIDLGFGKAKVGGESSDTAVTYGIGFKPGVSYALSDKCSLVAHFGFLGYLDGNDDAKAAGSLVDYEYGWGFNFSNNLSFGFYLNF